MKHAFMIVSITALALAPFNGFAAQSAPSLKVAQANPAPATTPATSSAPERTMLLFSQDELKKLLAPIALYPDPLLAQLLPASAYPLEIVQLARWLEKNPDAIAKQDFSGIDSQNWDPTVKAMARFPSLVKTMNDDLDWTSELGEAFIEQPDDVAATIQSLRASAQKTGALTTTAQQTVTTTVQNNRDVIVIEPTRPDQIYVPVYTEEVYSTNVGSVMAAGLLTFGTAVAVGALVNNATWNWGSGVVYPPIWGGAAWRPGRPVINGDVNVGSGNVINNSNLIGNTKPWRPDPQRLSAVQNRRADGARLNRSAFNERPDRAGRPQLEGRAPLADRSLSGDRVGNLQRPAKPTIERPHNRPQNTAFSGIDRGQAASAFAQRGAVSRGQIARPQGGARQAIHAGGGQRGGAVARGGGGRRR